MRVLFVVTNAFFFASIVERVRVYAGDKRVIIRVPQRIKHIYHHQVKKVPVYVLLPADEKKSKVLDDLQRVTKVLPCKESERERDPPWQDDIDIVDSGDSGALPKYRYARHYDALDTAATVSSTGRTISIKQPDSKRLSQMRMPPPLATTFQRNKKIHRVVADYRDIDSDFSYNKEGDSLRDDDGGVGDGGQFNVLATNIGSAPIKSQSQRSKSSVFAHVNKNKNDDDELAEFATSADRQKYDGSVSGNGAARTRYARYYDAQNVHKDARVEEMKANKPILMENGDDGAGAGAGGRVQQKNLIRISYPPTAQAPPSFSSADSSSFYANGAADAVAYASSMAAEAESRSNLNYHQHQLRHPYQQAPTWPQSPSASLPASAANDYASSYQYRVQH